MLGKKKGQEVESMEEGLREIYEGKMQKIERQFRFSDIHSPPLRPSDFTARPLVLLLGQYSTGKTSFIEYLLQQKYPASNVGPEPTTDRFVAVFHALEERVTPGNALVVQADKPFRGLEIFGSSFLNKFQGAELPAPLLKNFTFVDTPGVLSGEKQRLGRTYDFPKVCGWFAERADLILLLFDAHKLDISDEMKTVIESIRGHDDKIRVVLNKADSISSQELMRVYGALMWSLGKIFLTPEVVRVYPGSFWEEEYQNKEFEGLFEAEQKDLMADLSALPANAAIRKLNELVKRARLVKIHAIIIGHLRDSMPAVFGKDSKQKKLMKNLQEEFSVIQKLNRIPPGDMPDPKKYEAILGSYDFSKLPKSNPKLIAQLEEVLERDLTRLLHIFKEKEKVERVEGKAIPVPEGLKEERDPKVYRERKFAFGRGKKEDQRQKEKEKDKEKEKEPHASPSTPLLHDWAIPPHQRARYDALFASSHPSHGKLSGASVREVLSQFSLSKDILRNIWILSDMDEDGLLDADEFALAMSLAESAKKGIPLPTEIPAAVVPPNPSFSAPF